MDFATRLQIARKKQGLTMSELARRAGVSQSSLSYIEAGRQPTFDVIERICRGLGISLSDFFSSDAPAISPDLRRLLASLSRLTPAQRRALQSFLDALH